MIGRIRATVATWMMAGALLVLAQPAAAQPPQSTTQMSLAKSATFLTRVQYLMVQQARTILTESGVGSTHAARARHAANVVSSPAGYATVAAVMLTGGVNVIGTVVPHADPNLVDSSATDAAILSQIATFWNQLAGLDTGT